MATKIVNGYKARLGEFPSFVSVKIALADYLEEACGGTIIHPRVVLTAAHCLISRGTYSVGTTLKAPEFWHEDQNLKPIFASRRCRSDKFVEPELPGDASSARFDFGVLILDKPIKFGRHVQPACLPNSPVKNREQGIAVGNGLELDDGERKFTARSLNALPVERIRCKAAPEFVCFKASSEEYNGDVCSGKLGLSSLKLIPSYKTTNNIEFLHDSGDSGGPVYVERGGKQVLASVISHGMGKCQKGVTNIFYNFDIFTELKHVKDLVRTCAAEAGINNLVI